jgi:hypothetical protein
MAEKKVEERCFAGAVGSDEAGGLALLDMEIHLFDSHKPTEIFAQPFRFQDFCHPIFPCSFVMRFVGAEPRQGAHRAPLQSEIRIPNSCYQPNSLTGGKKASPE